MTRIVDGGGGGGGGRRPRSARARVSVLSPRLPPGARDTELAVARPIHVVCVASKLYCARFVLQHIFE